MKQVYGGIAHRVADHADCGMFDDRDEKGRGGIIAVALNNVSQSLVVTARRERQRTGDRGTVIDRRGVNLDDAVAHTQLTKCR